MRLAYLILAHKSPNQLQRLVNRLINDNVTVFIHLDKKVDDKQVFHIITGSIGSVRFIKRQAAVKWGAFSMIEATLNGLKEIMEYDCTFDYINLLSGMDYPIKKNKEILNFFEKNNGKEFIYYKETPSPDLPLGGRDRFEYYYDYDSEVSNKNEYESEMKSRSAKRNFIQGMKPYHGSQWWSLTGKCASYILNYIATNKEILNYYRYTKFPDEQFFQTIVMNSGFAGSVVDESLRYIDWSHVNLSNIDWINNPPHPKTLTQDDFHKLRYSKKLFARKFDENIDRVVLDLIDTLLLCYNGKL